MLFGFQDDGRLRDRQDFSALDQGKQIGGQALRMVISRQRVQRKGGYDFSAFDTVINQARQRGIIPQLVLDNREGFQSGMGDPAKYAAFVRAAGTHFKGRVGTYSLINEPDLKMAPAKYRQLYVRGQRALGRSDPQARVLFGEISSHGGIDYARKVIGKRGLTASGFAIHPYQINDPLAPPDVRTGGGQWGIGRTRTMQRDIGQMHLRTRAGKTPGLYFTEFGYDAANPNAAKFWPRALQKASQAGVRELLAYTLTGPTGANPTWDTGLLNSDNTARPAYMALARALAARR